MHRTIQKIYGTPPTVCKGQKELRVSPVGCKSVHLYLMIEIKLPGEFHLGVLDCVQ